MAYWTRKPNKQGQLKYVFIYTYKDGKTIQVPRKTYSFLDVKENHEIDAWVENWARKHEKLKITPGSVLYSNDNLFKLVTAFKEARLKEGKSTNTVNYQTNLLLNYAIPFFLSRKRPLKDPNEWVGAVNKLRSWLIEKKAPLGAMCKLRTALLKFWDFLREEGTVQTNDPLFVYRCSEPRRETPLKKTLDPEQVLSWVLINGAEEDLKLMALCGYFFSLRPQEIFALRKEDFDVGSDALYHECSKVMGELGLFNKLVVNISKQKKQDGSIKAPKTISSKASVCCFNEDAAGLLVKMLNKKSWSDLLVPNFNPDWNYERWRTNGIQGFTLKDLRRASIYWLGHHTKFGTMPIALQHHARHAKLETTELYLRRPTELPKQDKTSKNWSLSA